MPTVDRVLPWRRHHETAAVTELAPLLAELSAPPPEGPGRHHQPGVPDGGRGPPFADPVERRELHQPPAGGGHASSPTSGSTRSRWPPPCCTTPSRTPRSRCADVEANFGSEVATIVDGVTKLERIQFDSREAQQAATMRKMLVAMAQRPPGARHQARRPPPQHAHARRDARREAAARSPRRRSTSTPRWRTGSGIQEIKQQLEDLSFAALHPKRFAELDHLVATRTPEREVYLAQAVAEVRARLAELAIEAEVTGRGKHLWSIYEKMVVKGREFDDIFDLVAVRVIVDSIKDCYAALGSIHGRWRPVVGRFKDYIAMPKFNLYQSLHTTVIGPAGQADRGPDPHPRDAPAGGVGRRRPLGLQGRRRRPATSTG